MNKEQRVEAIKQDILKTFDEVYETAGETDLEKIDALNDRIDKKVADNKEMKILTIRIMPNNEPAKILFKKVGKNYL